MGPAAYIFKFMEHLHLNFTSEDNIRMLEHLF